MTYKTKRCGHTSLNPINHFLFAKVFVKANRSSLAVRTPVAPNLHDMWYVCIYMHL